MTRGLDKPNREAHRRNILLMNLSLFTAFLFFPFGISVHICAYAQ